MLNEKNQRLIFFGRYAGLAGMLDTLHGFGQKLLARGVANPFASIRQAYQYASLEEAKAEVAAVGAEIDEHGFPAELCPLVVGFAGYGNVSRGAQEIFDLLPHKILSAEALVEMVENFSNDNLNLFKVVFSEDDMVRAAAGDVRPAGLLRPPRKIREPSSRTTCPCSPSWSTASTGPKNTRAW